MYLGNFTFQFSNTSNTHTFNIFSIFLLYFEWIILCSPWPKIKQKHIRWKVSYKIIQLVNRRNDTTKHKQKRVRSQKSFLHKMYNMSTLFLQVSKMDRAIWGGKMFRVTRLDWFLFCLLKKKWANKTFMSIVIAHAQIANGNTSWKYGKK